MSNLRPEDWQRIAGQRLSPLYVSVHATEPALRRLLLGRTHLPDIREQLARLGEVGIEVHAQVVLCPGINDGEHLERTVGDLSLLCPPVRSVALVPVGLTRFRRGRPAGLSEAAAPLRSYRPAEAESLLQWAQPRQREFRRRIGLSFIYLADEFYLLAGRPPPAAPHYDGFPQKENGAGLVRLLLDDWDRVRRGPMDPLPRPLHITFTCGTLIAPVLQRLARQVEERLSGLAIQVLPLENRTFGSTVTVSGLLTGETFLQDLPPTARGDLIFLPRAAFDESGQRTLDDVSVEDVRERLDRPVFQVERMGEVVRILQSCGR